MIIFTHIAKTAGTSFTVDVAEKNVKVQKKMHHTSRSQVIGKKTKMLTGHIPFGIHRQFNIKKFKYIVFLRDPVNRWLSSLFDHLTRKDSLLPMWEKAKHNFKSFLEQCLEEDRNCNTMVKQLSGLEDKNNIVREYKHYAYLWAARNLKYDDDEMTKFLSQSEKNLSNEYFFVGFQSQISKDYAKLCKMLKWKYRSFGRRKDTGWKKSKIYKLYRKNIHLEDPITKKLILKFNEYDLKLYQFVIKNLK